MAKKKIPKRLISKDVSKQYFKALRNLTDSASEFLSSIDIFIKLEIEDGELVVYKPVIKDTEDQLIEQHNEWAIWNLLIGEIDWDCDGFPAKGVETYKPFEREYKDSFDFCINNMLQVTICPSVYGTEFGLTGGTTTVIKFPLYFYKYTKVDNGVILNVCSEDELIENHFDIAENIFEDFM